jgi:hypothetical protein
MRHCAIAAILAFGFVLPVRSEAASSPKAREKAAKKACAAGDYRKGVDILADLYVNTDDSTYVYNQGRCYEQNHQWVGAIDRFREYLRKTPQAPASVVAEVEKHIADCEAFREQEEPKPALPPVAPPPPAPVATPAPVPVPAPPTATAPAEPAVVERPAPPVQHRGSGLRVTGIVLGSVGIAAAVTGLVLNLKANNLAEDYDRTQDPATKSSQSSYKTGSMVCYGAGAVSLAAGVVLYLVGRSVGRSGETTSVSLMPVLTPSGFSLTMGKVF